MDIVLQIHSDDAALAFEEVRRFADDSGYCFQLAVRSHGFAARALFCVEPEAWEAFRVAVAEIDRTLAGRARLAPRYEAGFVELAAGATGAVLVSGEVVRVSAYSQRLRFEFRTDQTCLQPLARDLAAGAIVVSGR